jgi:hypothetical protein
MAHTLAHLVYRMLNYGQDDVDQGMKFYQPRYQRQQVNWIEKKANILGLVITPDSGPSGEGSLGEVRA